jgi:hypothetical protein
MVQAIHDQWAIAIAALAAIGITVWLFIDSLIRGAGRRGR